MAMHGLGSVHPEHRRIPHGLPLGRLTHRLLALGLVALFGTAMAGSVEGAAPPGHQEIADQLLPAWSQTLPAADRFVLVMDGAAVLDRETGVVWEQAPDSESAFDRQTWYGARAFCNQRLVGNRKGWRLPTVQELASLVDPTQFPALPAGHPFTIAVQPEPFNYWSSTTQIEEPSRAWFVNFGNVTPGFVFTFDKVPGDPANNFFVWCVRGGHGGPDAQ